MGKTAEDMQKAVEAYQSELAKVQRRGSESIEEEVVETDKASVKSDQVEEDSTDGHKFNNPLSNPSPISPHPHLSGQSLSTLFPKIDEKISSSPLQGMASITNSLTAQPAPSAYRPPQRSFKAILPPITQEQFDKYESINTEDIVRKVSQKIKYSYVKLTFNIKRKVLH